MRDSHGRFLQGGPKRSPGLAVGTYPELVVVSRGALLDEGPVVRGDVPVVGVLLQHVDLKFDLLLLVLHTHTHTHSFRMLNIIFNQPACKLNSKLFRKSDRRQGKQTAY